MNELPNPTMPLSPVSLPRGSLHRPDQVVAAPGRGILVSWAQHQDEVRQAQRLRYQVFAKEMGARLDTWLPGHDVDLFDDYCEHLLVRDEQSHEVIGTYRVLTPAQALRVGSTYSDTEFDLTRLRGLARAHGRAGPQLRAPRPPPWGRHPGPVGRAGGVHDAQPARHHDRLREHPHAAQRHRQRPCRGQHLEPGEQTHLAPIEYQVRPRLPLPVEELDGTLDVEPPALIKGYLRLGAKVLGPPAWDPDFNSADLPMLMRIQDLPPRYRKHFLGA